MERQKLISKKDEESYLAEKFDEIKKELTIIMPLADSEFCANAEEWIFNSNIFAKIHKSEIPSRLKKLSDNFEFENYQKFLIYNGIGKKLEYFVSENDIVLGFYENTLCEMWVEK